MSDNNYEMIFQYCLSVYAINFFTSPNFSNFKIRIINQQNGDCNDSKLLNSTNLTQNTFPVLIKIKGGQRLLLKIKMISIGQAKVEKDIGEGVISFNKTSIDDSMRVPIYDKKKGVQEVAICSLDLFISGHFLVEKNVSGGGEKSKSKIEDWRDRSEDAIFSQVSYTVESENQELELQLQTEKSGKEHKQTQLAEKIQKASDKPEPLKLQNKESRVQVQGSLFKESIGKVQKRREQQREGLSLHNIPYRSDTLNKQTIELPPEETNSNLFNHSSLQNEDSLSPQKVRQKIKQNEELMDSLKKYLSRSEENKKINFKHHKHKYRRRMVQIQDFSSYLSPKNYLNYHIAFKSQLCKVIYDFKVQKYRELHSLTETLQEVPLDKIEIYSSQDVKIVTFQALSFRSYCIVNEVAERYPKLKFPGNQTSLKVKITLEKYGKYEGKVGVQEGENMMIDLIHLAKLIENRELERDVFKFKFSIGRKYSEAKLESEVVQPEVSLNEPEEVVDKTDIKSRIKSLSMQPWGYGCSHETLVQSQRSDARSRSIDIKKRRKVGGEQKHPRKYNKDEDVGSPSGKMAIRPFETSSQVESDSNQRSTALGIKQTTKRQLPDKREMFLLRNGNRNNYKYKEIKASREKYPNLKEMWQRLLIRKKIEEEELTEQEQLKETRKQVATALSFKNNKKRGEKYQLLGRKQERKHRLYGCAAGSKEVVRVGQEWPKQFNSKEEAYPLRTFSLEINNIAITQSQMSVDDEQDESLGKFVKLSIRGKVTYFTEIIFSKHFNSILWKLSGCLFLDLFGRERLTLQIFETIKNTTVLIGKASLRVSKLYFLRKNHICNGTFQLQDEVNGEYTLGFEVKEQNPFDAILQEEEEEQRVSLRRTRMNTDFLGKKREYEGMSRKGESLEKGKDKMRESSDLEGPLMRNRRKTQKGLHYFSKKLESKFSLQGNEQ